MRRRAGLALAAAMALFASGLALLLTSDRDRSRQESAATGARPFEAPPRIDLRSELRTELRSSARRERRAQARHESADGEPGPQAVDLRHYTRLQSQAEPVARRFLAAFSRYELGRHDRRVASTLEATATPRLARQLLQHRPRTLRAPAASRPARLGFLEFVPGVVSVGRVVSAELVGQVDRGAESDPIAIELRLTQNRWRVTGLGR